ncbi:MAG: hypothetical protein ACLUT5_13185 [Butyricicoccus sp.]
MSPCDTDPADQRFGGDHDLSDRGTDCVGDLGMFRNDQLGVQAAAYLGQPCRHRSAERNDRTLEPNLGLEQTAMPIEKEARTLSCREILLCAKSAAA